MTAPKTVQAVFFPPDLLFIFQCFLAFVTECVCVWGGGGMDGMNAVGKRETYKPVYIHYVFQLLNSLHLYTKHLKRQTLVSFFLFTKNKNNPPNNIYCMQQLNRALLII